MKQTEVEVELRGPPVAKAFDQDGNPTKVGYPISFTPVVILLFLGLFCSLMHKYVHEEILFWFFRSKSVALFTKSSVLYQF